MKHRILILLLFFAAPAAVFSQTIFTAGLTYCAGPPSHNPGGTGSRYAIDTVTFDLYVRSTGTTWSKAGDWLQFRTGTGTPAAPPSKFESVFAINAADSLYYYDGATWNHLNKGGGITDGNKGDITVSSSGTVWDINSGVVGPTELASTAVTPGSYTNTSLTVDADGRLTAASSGAAGVTGTGLANRVGVFQSGTYIGYESTLRVDTVNNRLMIGSQIAPTQKLHVESSDDLSALFNSSNTAGTGIEIKNTSGAGYDWKIGVGGASAPSASMIGDLFFYNITSSLYSSVTFNSDGGVDFFSNISGNDVRFFIGASQKGRIRRSDLFFAMPYYGSYSNDNFSLAEVTSSDIKAGLNLGTNAVIEFSSGSSWFAVKDVGFKRVITNTIDLSNGSTGYGNIRLNTIRGKGTTNATWSLRAANSLDSVVIYAPDNRRVGINTTTPDCELDVAGTGGIAFPSGTTAQRLAVDNQIRTDTDVDGVEVRYRGDWYRLTSDVTPSVSAGAGLGSGGSVSCVGNDLGGTITFTTGSTAVTGDLFTATFAGAFSSGNVITVTFSARNAAAAAETAKIYVSAESTTAFTLTSWTALTDETEYKINYKISQ